MTFLKNSETAYTYPQLELIIGPPVELQKDLNCYETKRSEYTSKSLLNLMIRKKNRSEKG